MSLFVMRLCTILWGFAAGVVMSTALTAFVSIVGVVPRLALKTQITKHYFALGTAVTLGICTGSMLSVWKPQLAIPKLFIIIISFAFGIFIGGLAVSIVEILDVIPITSRRSHLKRGIYLFIIAFAMGKMVGALYYWLYPGFTTLLL